MGWTGRRRRRSQLQLVAFVGLLVLGPKKWRSFCAPTKPSLAKCYLAAPAVRLCTGRLPVQAKQMLVQTARTAYLPRAKVARAAQEGQEATEVRQGPKINLVFLGTYLAYAACYLARNNAAVTKAPLIQVLGAPAMFDSLSAFATPEAALGCLDATFLLAYTIGSFVVPAAVDLDRKDPWQIVWSALTLTGAVQLGLWMTWTSVSEVGFSWPLVFAAGMCCAVNGLAQSILYPACKQLMANEFGARGIVLGFWNTCYYLGGACSTLAAAATCDLLGWQAAYLVPGIFLLGGAFAGNQAVRSGLNKDSTSSSRAEADEGVSKKASSSAARLSDLLWPPDLRLRFVAVQYFVVKLVRYAIGLWLPLLLATSQGGVGAENLLKAIGSAALFDVGSMLGSFGFGAAVDYFGLQALSGMTFVSVAALALMLPLIPQVLASDPSALWILLLGLGLATGGSETSLGSIGPIYCSQTQPTSRQAREYSAATAVASVNGYGSLGTVGAALILPVLAGKAGAAGLGASFAQLAPLAWIASAVAAFQFFTEGKARSKAPASKQTTRNTN